VKLPTAAINAACIDNQLTQSRDRTIRTDGPQNMAIVRHAALNLPSRAKPTISSMSRRDPAGWNVYYLETIIRQTA
jgi:hypothetical protein